MPYTEVAGSSDPVLGAEAAEHREILRLALADTDVRHVTADTAVTGPLAVRVALRRRSLLRQRGSTTASPAR
ncbi:hypothetical protein ACNPQM_28205 [Streptomyces sp. NPDC056231]|uniref:hypothetical protein n=1 Tax=unclassified Streptomyces TaxID=2593676 RepID=UPI0034046222